MKRVAQLLALTLVAVPMLARVISYAPYTNRVATAAFQERTARHFALIESATWDPVFRANSANEVVLYDSAGVDEPRVIRPRAGMFYEQVALYQKAGGTPILLTVGRDSQASNWFLLSPQISVSEGGNDWRTVQGNLLGPFHVPQVVDTDTGGPYTHGLHAPIVLGNDAWPFIVTLGNNGVWAFNKEGVAKKIYAGADARVIGRNRAGDRFLIYSMSGIWSTTVDGPATRIAVVDPLGAYSGWITSSGSAYIQMLRAEGRFLYTTAAGTTALQFIAGPYNTAAPPVGAPQQTFPTMRFFAVPSLLMAQTPLLPSVTMNGHVSLPRTIGA